MAWLHPRKKAKDVAVTHELAALWPGDAEGRRVRHGSSRDAWQHQPRGGIRDEAGIASLPTPTVRVVRSLNGTLWSHSCEVSGGCVHRQLEAKRGAWTGQSESTVSCSELLNAPWRPLSHRWTMCMRHSSLRGTCLHR